MSFLIGGICIGFIIGVVLTAYLTKNPEVITYCIPKPIGPHLTEMDAGLTEREFSNA